MMSRAARAALDPPLTGPLSLISTTLSTHAASPVRRDHDLPRPDAGATMSNLRWSLSPSSELASEPTGSASHARPSSTRVPHIPSHHRRAHLKITSANTKHRPLFRNQSQRYQLKRLMRDVLNMAIDLSAQGSYMWRVAVIDTSLVLPGKQFKSPQSGDIRLVWIGDYGRQRKITGERQWE
ncbi:hypothetical protein IWX48DRAFT_102395 [Phyllosticta citricarpa]